MQAVRFYVDLPTCRFLDVGRPRFPNMLEKNCWNLSNAFLEKCACSFDVCLLSFWQPGLGRSIPDVGSRAADTH